ncbi:MAG: hypothetical protein H8E46_00250 [FCB group bacterium]|nr:hypothetical protein [FCB group bacterium]
MNKKTIVSLLMILTVAAISAIPASAQKKCGTPCGSCPSAVVCEPSEKCVPCGTCSHEIEVGAAGEPCPIDACCLAELNNQLGLELKNIGNLAFDKHGKLSAKLSDEQCCDLASAYIAFRGDKDLKVGKITAARKYYEAPVLAADNTTAYTLRIDKKTARVTPAI